MMTLKSPRYCRMRVGQDELISFAPIRPGPCLDPVSSVIPVEFSFFVEAEMEISTGNTGTTGQ